MLLQLLPLSIREGAEEFFSPAVIQAVRTEISLPAIPERVLHYPPVVDPATLAAELERMNVRQSNSIS